MNRQILFLAALTMSACVTVQTDISSDLSAVESTLPAGSFPLVTGPSASNFETLFTDPLLRDYLAAAQNQNASLELARIAVASAEARRELANANRGPRVRLGGSTGIDTPVSDFDLEEDGRVSASVSYDPDVFGSLRANLRGATAREAVADAELARLRRVIQARTAQAYIDVITAELQLELAQDNFEFLGETLRVSEARFNAGDIARADYALSQAEYENSRASLLAQQLSTRESRRALADLVGRYDVEDLPIAAQLPTMAVSGVDLAAGAQRAVLARYDVQAQRFGVIAATADADATKAQTLPGFSIDGSLGGGAGLEDLLDIDTYLARLALAVSDTIFDNGADSARIAAAQTQIDASLVRYEEALRDAYREVVSALDRAEVFRARLAALDKASAAAERALELEEVRYDLGESILLDVLTLQRRVNSIQSSRIREEASVRNALIEALLAAGPVR